jgi:serpin B
MRPGMRTFLRSSSLFSSLLALSVGSLTTAVGCSGSSSSAPEVQTATSTDARDTQPNVPASDASQLETGNETFAFALYGQVARAGGSGGNLFFSPYSISLALSMAYAGAATTTATEMATALDFTLPPAQLFPAFDQLDLAITTTPPAASTPGATNPAGTPPSVPFTLKVANSLWAAKDLTFVPSFLDTLATDYGAPVRLADFLGNPDGARSEINQWIASETNGKLPAVLGPGSILSSTKLALVDALYFDASWQQPFETAQDGTLTWNGAGGPTQVDSMAQENDFAYGHANGIQAVELPYSGGTTSMIVLMPDATGGNTASAPLTAEAYDAAIASLEPTEMILTMPKFRISGATISLKDELSALGMADAFTPGADFSALSPMPLYIQDVLHQAYVNVDDNGTEAAAATVVTLAGGAANPATLPQVTLDHPFTFVIRDIASGTILFAGYLAAP